MVLSSLCESLQSRFYRQKILAIHLEDNHVDTITYALSISISHYLSVKFLNLFCPSNCGYVTKFGSDYPTPNSTLVHISSRFDVGPHWLIVESSISHLIDTVNTLGNCIGSAYINFQAARLCKYQ